MNPDSKIYRFLAKTGDYFILNFVYLVSCIPIVTIGAATTALYYSTLKMAENREGYVWQDYVNSFKRNFKQATIIWMIMLLFLAVLFVDGLLMGALGEALGAVVGVAMIVAAIFLVLTGLYVFPVLARFDNTVLHTVRNALLMAIRHLPSTLLILVIHSLPMLLALVSVSVFLRGVLVVLIFFVSELAYLEAKLFSHVFDHYYAKSQISIQEEVS